MQVFWTKALAYFEARWHTLSGGILASLAAIVFTFLGLQISGVFTLLPVTALSITAGITTVGFWISSNRVPKVPPNTIAVVVGLACDTPAHQTQVTADFIDELAKTLRHGDTRFSFTELPSWILPRLKNDALAFKLFRQTRAHLMVFGTVRERNVKGRSAHLLSLRGLVRHAPVSPEIQKLISEDFNKVLPDKIVIDKADDALTFELHSDRIGTGARYIVGLAAFVSGDLGLAEQLFLQVERKLTEEKLKGSQPGAFLKQVRIRLHELYTVWAKSLYDAYYTSRDKNVLHPLDAVSSKLINRNPEHYSALLGKAICDFVLRRDVISAHENITKAQTPHDMTWLYGRAFLHAYSGKLQDAAREYRQIFSGVHREHTAPLQSEEFIQIVLNEEPSRSELHYCLGQINFFVKQDFAQARLDFETFLSSTPINKHPKQRKEAQKLIEECKTKACTSSAPQPELPL